MAYLIIDVYQGANRKCLAIGNHRISVGKPYGFLEKVESYKCDTKDILSCIGTVNRWIPCSDRLPEQGQRVIVQCRCGKDTAISTARRTHSGSWIVDFLRYADKECITIQAWMPMPDAYEPPESEVHGDAAEKP